MDSQSLIHHFYDLPTPVVLISVSGECLSSNRPASELSHKFGFTDCSALLPEELVKKVLDVSTNLVGDYADIRYQDSESYRWQIIVAEANQYLLQAFNQTDREQSRAILENSVDGIYKTN
ncbi:hypothetical protein ABMA58_20800, partial [Oceanospirillum sp. HFRX-1_2]